jgi:hypothetical protein
MPILPSGLSLGISRNALIDQGRNQYHCPEGHFWYWDIAPETGPAPFDPDTEILQIQAHALAPTNREEAKRFIRVFEILDDGLWRWRGERLDSFPRYMTLDDRDAAAWQSWLEGAKMLQFLDETVEICRRLSKVARESIGYVVAVAAAADPDVPAATGNRVNVVPVAPDSNLLKGIEPLKRQEPGNEP